MVNSPLWFCFQRRVEWRSKATMTETKSVSKNIQWSKKRQEVLLLITNSDIKRVVPKRSIRDVLQLTPDSNITMYSKSPCISLGNRVNGKYIDSITHQAWCKPDSSKNTTMYIYNESMMCVIVTTQGPDKRNPHGILCGKSPSTYITRASFE